MTAGELIGLITGGLTIIGAVVAVTRYVTELQYKVRQERLQTEKELADKRIEDLEARGKELLNQLVTAKRVGTAALNQKMEIDDELALLMRNFAAGAASIYVPLPGSAGAQELVFLSIQPLGKQAEKLRKKIIPMHSSAGRCFTSGNASASVNSKKDPEHYDKADRVSGYQTEDMLNVPLRSRGETVGVLQLLNRVGGGHFGEDDVNRIQPLTPGLAEKVAEFVRYPANFEILGVMPQQDMKAATVMFCDLTRSSVLFQEMSASAAVQHINEYLERVCDIGFSHGATIDKYIGDGVLLRFNVPRALREHPLKAVTAALAMRDTFDKLKTDWVTMGEPVGKVFLRIGLAYGLVHETVVGHPQHQSLTIFGQPINVAVNLCDAAVRDRSTIVLDDRLYNEISTKVRATVLPSNELGKAARYIKTAYQLEQLA